MALDASDPRLLLAGAPSPHIERVIVHTDGVSSNSLVLRKVDYIDGVSDLYLSKGNIFDGVFTKLAVWKLEDYA